MPEKMNPIVPALDFFYSAIMCTKQRNNDPSQKICPPKGWHGTVPGFLTIGTLKEPLMTALFAISDHIYRFHPDPHLAFCLMEML